MRFKRTDTIGAIVTNNLQAASVFNNYGIDYYSQGNRTLETACIDENAPIVGIMEELYELRERNDSMPDFSSMSMVALYTYILRTHHAFAENKLVFIRNTMDRFIRNYAMDDPRVAEIRKKIEELALYLTVHMHHEQFIIFPYIHKMVRTAHAYTSFYRTIQDPISSMINDHEHEVSMLKALANLTNNYAISPKYDYSLKVSYSAMKELEEDLKIHMHLENNILFPNALNYLSAQ